MAVPLLSVICSCRGRSVFAVPALAIPGFGLDTTRFSTLLYIFENEKVVDSMFTAMWVSTVTVTTVGWTLGEWYAQAFRAGYGDITPETLAGKTRLGACTNDSKRPRLMGGLCFFSSLFMAMPISVLGNAMSHAWTDRNRILLMARTRQRLKRHGFNAADLPRLFRQYVACKIGEASVS